MEEETSCVHHDVLIVKSISMKVRVSSGQLPDSKRRRRREELNDSHMMCRRSNLPLDILTLAWHSEYSIVKSYDMIRTNVVRCRCRCRC